MKKVDLSKLDLDDEAVDNRIGNIFRSVDYKDIEGAFEQIDKELKRFGLELIMAYMEDDEFHFTIEKKGFNVKKMLKQIQGSTSKSLSLSKVLGTLEDRGLYKSAENVRRVIPTLGGKRLSPGSMTKHTFYPTGEEIGKAKIGKVRIKNKVYNAALIPYGKVKKGIIYVTDQRFKRNQLVWYVMDTPSGEKRLQINRITTVNQEIVKGGVKGWRYYFSPRNWYRDLFNNEEHPEMGVVTKRMKDMIDKDPYIGDSFLRERGLKD
jgi:hypothetical protein